MINRLADLEQQITRRTAKRPDIPQPSPNRSALQRAQHPSFAPGTPGTPSAGLSAKVSRWPSRSKTTSLAAQVARTYNAISYDVPGVFEVIAQPNSMACWATVFTMLKMWRTQQRMSIETALGTVGQRWVDIYKTNTGLYSADKPAFISSAGLVAEPPQSYSLEDWEHLLRNYGPIWVTTDEPAGLPWATDSRIITGIYGDGTPAGTKFKIIDPVGGRRYEESIATFIPKYEEEVISNGHMRIQVMHWQPDARSEQSALSFGHRSIRAAYHPEAMQDAAKFGAVIVGATVTRILNNEGDIKWELDQLKGIKHIYDDPKNEGSKNYKLQVIPIKGPRASNTGFKDYIYVDSEITFQYNDSSLGNVQISIVGNNDAILAGMLVKAKIMDDANAYTTTPPSAHSFAAIKVRIEYHFNFSLHNDWIWIDDIVLYGNGTISFKRRRTQ